MLKRIALFAALALLNSLNAAQVKVLAPEAITNLVNATIVTHDSSINVKSYGAVGDGITDDSDAFAAALTDTNYNCILIPPGIYAINLTISKASSSKILRGVSGTTPEYSGTTNVILVPYSTNFPVIKTIESTAILLSGFALENVTFSGVKPGAAAWGKIGLEVSGGTYGCRFSNLAFEKFIDYGLKISNDVRPNYYNNYDNLIIEPAQYLGSKAGAGLGIIYNPLAAESITSQYFNKVHCFGGPAQHIVKLDGASADFVQGWWQAYPNAGLILTNGAKARMNQIIFDSNDSADTLIEVLNDLDSYNNLWALDGNFQCDGRIAIGKTNYTESIVLTNGINYLWSAAGAFGTNLVKSGYRVIGNGIPTNSFVGDYVSANYVTLVNDAGASVNATSSSTETLTFVSEINGKTFRSILYHPISYAPSVVYRQFFLDDTSFYRRNINATTPYIGAGSGNFNVNGNSTSLRLNSSNSIYLNTPTIDFSSSSFVYQHGGYIVDNAKKFYFKDSRGASPDVLFSSADGLYMTVATNWRSGFRFYDPQATYTNRIITDLDIIPSVASTNNLGSSTKPWKSVFADSLPTISVKSFGAVGNGIVDDTAAFNAAIAASGGKTIYVPPGIYAVNITVNANNIKILGDSFSAETPFTNCIVPYNTNYPAIKLETATPGTNLRGVSLENLAIYGTGPNGQGSTGLLIGNGSYACAFSKLNIVGFANNNLAIVSTNTGMSHLFFDSIVSRCLSTGVANALYMDYATAAGGYVTTCQFVNCAFNGPSSGTGYGAKLLGVRPQFLNTWFQCNGNYGIYLGQSTFGAQIAQFVANQVEVECTPVASICVTNSFNTSAPNGVIVGSARFNGTYANNVGTKWDISNVIDFENYGIKSNPIVNSKLYFQDSATTNFADSSVPYLRNLSGALQIVTPLSSATLLSGSNANTLTIQSADATSRLILKDSSARTATLQQSSTALFITPPSSGETRLYDGSGNIVATVKDTNLFVNYYDDLPPRQLQVGTTAPATSATFRDLVQTYQFSGSASNQIYLSWQMPHAWKEGSTVYPHIHYSPSTITANSNTVWLLEYTWQNINGTFGATSSSQITNAFIPVQYSHNLAAFPSISGAGKTISSILVCRLVRRPEDGGDDYGNAVNLLAVDLHILCDTLGSRTETAK